MAKYYLARLNNEIKGANMTTTNEPLEGICPDCKAQLVLGEGIVEGDTFSRDARCSQCDFEGEQIYTTWFSLKLLKSRASLYRPIARLLRCEVL